MVEWLAIVFWSEVQIPGHQILQRFEMFIIVSMLMEVAGCDALALRRKC